MIAEHFDQLVQWEGLPVAYAPPWSKSSWSMVGLSGITIKLVENGPMVSMKIFIRHTLYIKHVIAQQVIEGQAIFYVISASHLFL